MSYYTVITGDIVDFTQLSPEARRMLIGETENLIQSWVNKPVDAQVFRGDSFQLLLENAGEALVRGMQLICWFKKSEVQHKGLNVRLSIGIGEISYRGNTVLDSDGEAFHQSGRNFDKMGEHDLLIITTPDKELNQQFSIIFMFINLIMRSWSSSQAEALFNLLEHKTQTEIAAKLGVSQSAINKRLKSSYWKEVEKAIRFTSDSIEKKWS